MSKSIIKQKRILTKAGGGSSISTPVSVANGGTGISSYAIGDIIYASGATTLSKLAIGTANQQLRVNAGATALEYFTPTSGGISIGDTIGNSPVTGSILMAIGTTLTQSISYRAQQATPFLTAFGFESANSGSFSGVNNTFYGWRAGKLNTTGTDNLFSGFEAGSANTTGSRNLYLGSWISGDMTATATQNDNVGLGYRSLTLAVAGQNVAVGNNAAQSVGVGNTATGYNSMALSNNAATYNTCSGHNSGSGITGSFNSLCGVSTSSATFSFSGGFGFFSTNTANNQLMLGGSNAGFGGYNDVCIGNGNTNSSATSVILRVTSGSGTNNAGANITIAGGKGTGSAVGGNYIVSTSTTLGSGTTLQTLVPRLTISGGAVTTDASTATWADALDHVLGTTTGSKWGTSTSQKQSFWNATPIVQPTTAYAAATLVGGAGTNITDTDTFDGYTLKQIVAALRGIGLLA